MQMTMYLVGTLRESVYHLHSTFPRNHCAQGVAKFERFLAQILDNAITAIYDGKQTPRSGMRQVVDLPHYLNNWLVHGDLRMGSPR